MKKGLTELAFIIDRSGSMSGLEDDTIGGFNSMLKEQQAVEGKAYITTVLFDDRYKLLHDRIDIQAVAPLTREDYTVRGSTALLDAIGKQSIRSVKCSVTQKRNTVRKRLCLSSSRTDRKMPAIDIQQR